MSVVKRQPLQVRGEMLSVALCEWLIKGIGDHVEELGLELDLKQLKVIEVRILG